MFGRGGGNKIRRYLFNFSKAICTLMKPSCRHKMLCNCLLVRVVALLLHCYVSACECLLERVIALFLRCCCVVVALLTVAVLLLLLLL